MAEKLSIQIALEGGAEIERQLADIGEAGQKAFADITASAEQAGGFKQLKPEEVTAKLQEMGVTGVDAIDKIQAAVKSAGRLETLVQGVETLQTALKAMAVAAPIVGTALVAAFTAAAKAAISFAKEINKVNETAIKLGAPVEKLDGFRRGLEQAGVSAESLGQILQSKLATEQGVRGLEAFIRALERMPEGAARSKAAVEAFGNAGAELIRILQAGGRLTGQFGAGLISEDDARKATELGQALNRLEATFTRLGSVNVAPQLTAGINVVTAAVQSLSARLEAAPWTTFFSAVLSPFQTLASLITTTIASILGFGPAVEQVGTKTAEASTLFTQWGTRAEQSAQQATTAFTSFGTTVQQTGQQTAQAGQTAASGWDVFLAKLNEIALAAGRILGGGGGGGGGKTPAMAGGGLLGGRGTGTSDSNLAWVSRGEHIMPARAVQQPGVLSFLEALRRSGGNLSRVLDGMGRFALGGLVPRAIPAFATGGLAGGSNVTIQFPGLPAIGGLRASADVVDQLHKAAALAQVRSGGRKPSRYS